MQDAPSWRNKQTVQNISLQLLGSSGQVRSGHKTKPFSLCPAQKQGSSSSKAFFFLCPLLLHSATPSDSFWQEDGSRLWLAAAGDPPTPLCLSSSFRSVSGAHDHSPSPPSLSLSLDCAKGLVGKLRPLNWLRFANGTNKAYKTKYYKPWLSVTRGRGGGGSTILCFVQSL